MRYLIKWYDISTGLMDAMTVEEELSFAETAQVYTKSLAKRKRKLIGVEEL